MARNRYIDSFCETSFSQVMLPFNLSHLQQLLEQGLCLTGLYTHQQICDWAQRFVSAIREDRDKPDQIPFLEIIEDIGVQWDMCLYNNYSLTELQALDLSQVRLPHEWFVDWLRRLEQESA